MANSKIESEDASSKNQTVRVDKAFLLAQLESVYLLEGCKNADLVERVLFFFDAELAHFDLLHFGSDRERGRVQIGKIGHLPS